MEYGPEIDKIAAALTILAFKDANVAALRKARLMAERDLAKSWGVDIGEMYDPTRVE